MNIELPELQEALTLIRRIFEIVKKDNFPEKEEIEKPLNSKEAAAFLGCSLKTLYTYENANQIPYHRKGKRGKYYFKSELINSEYLIGKRSRRN